MRRTSKKQDYIFYILFILIFVWILVSWIEVITKNLDSNSTYCGFNCFVLLLKLSKAIRG